VIRVVGAEFSVGSVVVDGGHGEGVAIVVDEVLEISAGTVTEKLLERHTCVCMCECLFTISRKQ